MTLAQDALRLDTNWVDYLLVAFYFVLVLGIASARRSVSSSLDFLLSGVRGVAFGAPRRPATVMHRRL